MVWGRVLSACLYVRMEKAYINMPNIFQPYNGKTQQKGETKPFCYDHILFILVLVCCWSSTIDMDDMQIKTRIIWFCFCISVLLNLHRALDMFNVLHNFYCPQVLLGQYHCDLIWIGSLRLLNTLTAYEAFVLTDHPKIVMTLNYFTVMLTHTSLSGVFLNISKPVGPIFTILCMIDQWSTTNDPVILEDHWALYF